MSFPGVPTSMTVNDIELGFKWMLRYFRLWCTLKIEFSLKYTGYRPRLPAYEIKLMLLRVSWALAQISCMYKWAGWHIKKWNIDASRGLSSRGVLDMIRLSHCNERQLQLQWTLLNTWTQCLTWPPFTAIIETHPLCTTWYTCLSVKYISFQGRLLRGVIPSVMSCQHAISGF